MRLHPIVSALVCTFLLGMSTARAANIPVGTTSCGALGAGQACTLTATGATGQITWSLNPQVGALAQPTTGPGNSQSNTYTAPPVVTSKTTITVSVVDAAGNTGAAAVTIVGGSITLNPTSASISTSQSQSFNATVAGETNTGVNWTFTPQIGTLTVIDANDATYTAPSVVSASTKVTITATSKADPTISASATVTITQAIDIGSGAPNLGITQQFVTAFYRNGFNNLVGLPPLGRVTALGTTAGYYVQEFPDAAKDAGVKYALATASATSTAIVNGDGTINNVVQIYGPVYAYYTSIGASTAGYPLSDTLNCPSFDPANSCLFQFFDKSYALFVYSSALGTTGATNFSISAGIYTEWTALGGIGNIGRPISTPATVTATKIAPATAGSTASAQSFSSGVIFNITSGSAKGQVHGVTEPLYDLYVQAGGPTGPLGLPTSEVVVNTVTGLRKQTFEGGVLQYTPGGSGGIQYPVTGISLAGDATAGSTVTLKLGQSVTVTATPIDAFGDLLTSLPVSWSTSNGQVIAVQPQAGTQSAVLTAVGGGSARVTAASGGFTSGAVSFVVIAPCCQVGDGAPPTVQQAFQSALTRNKITVQTPVPSPAARSGNGYTQMVQSTATPPLSYLLAQSDQSGSAYVITGALLAAYQNLGGASGALGYPVADATAGGTQLFQNAALAGSPVQVVSVGILTKWASLGYETGAAGAPVSGAAPFSTFGANSGVLQNFANGAIYAATAGPRSGSAYFVTGSILAAYNSQGGVSGSLGMPTGDAVGVSGGQRQNFEGGSVTVTSAASPQIQVAPRTPAVIAAPSSISAGARALLAISGFPNGDSITVSVTGEPAFVVTAANGAFTWNRFIPLTAASGTLTISAKGASGASASGALTIRGFDKNRVQITVVSGNNQTGAPGALLPLPVSVALLDSSGAPVIGAPVVFTASAGAQISLSNTVTDSTGTASTYLRLPPVSGLTGVTAASTLAQAPVTLYATAAAASISSFPNIQENGSAVLGNGSSTIGQKGALLSAVAGILRYQQNRNAVGSPNGLADASTLNQFLTTYCTVDGNSTKTCDGFLANPASGEQIVNLWRAAQFTGGIDVTALSPTIPAIADVVSTGEPVLLSLGLALNGAMAGGHFVVATGVASDGSILIQDPSPLFARTNWNDYLKGFTAGAGTWTGSLLAAVRFAVRSPNATRFLLGELSQPASLVNSMAFDISSPNGSCGLPVPMWDTVDSAGNPPANGPLVTKLQVCDGALPAYQVSVGVSQPYEAFVTDLAASGPSIDLSGAAPVVDQASRPVLNLLVTPVTANFSAAGVVNAATFTSSIAPGGIVSIFGGGLASSAGPTKVDVDGEPLNVLSASAFQVNAVLPGDVAPGPHQLRVQSPFGTGQQSISVSSVAPAIFLVGNPATGAVENQDGSLNTATNPAMRGQVVVIYATGLGATTLRNGLSLTNSTVTVVVNGVELPVAYAGLAPGYSGLYQVNVMIPTGTVPGLGLSLTLKEGGVSSNSVTVCVQ